MNKEVVTCGYAQVSATSPLSDCSDFNGPRQKLVDSGNSLARRRCFPMRQTRYHKTSRFTFSNMDVYFQTISKNVNVKSLK